MISHVAISGLGVIRATDLDLVPGLVVFTGETGAGKTMVVSALGLVLGDRFDTSLLGPDGTRVHATVDLPSTSPALERVREAGGEVNPVDDQLSELIIGRHVPSSGRGRAVAGGATVPLSVLAEVGETVAQRHSQSDQIGLRSTRTQRHALDRFAGDELADVLTEYREHYRHYLELSARLAHLTAAGRERTDRIERIRAELTAIDEVAPVPGEEDQVTATIARLANAEALQEDLSLAEAALTGDDDGAAAQLGRSADAVRRAVRHDPALQPLVDRLLALQEQIGDIGADLRVHLSQVSADPGQLATLQARKAQLTRLTRRFGATTPEVVAYADSVRAELADLTGNVQDVAELRSAVAAAVTDLASAADRLTTARRQAAERLSARVSAELAGLAMPQARFVAEVDHRADPAGLTLPDGSSVAFGESGTDVVRFLLAPHAGASPAPIGDGASGGELSRIMLALEVVLAETSPPSVFIFDEVDAGIGGRTAVEVGRRLARLAQRSQVLVVTHLPQVASFADQHIVVRKDSDGMVTATSVLEVTGADRAAELSRMLSGQEDSAAALAHAEELLDLAAIEADARRGSPR